MQILQLFFLFCMATTKLLGEAYDSNLLIYGDSVQVNSEIDKYEKIAANKPIHGTIMITYNPIKPIDVNNFTIGNKPLKVEFVRSVPMSSNGNLIVSIYEFQIEGLPKGEYTLPAIAVKVGDKKYEAVAMTVQIDE